MNVLIVSLALSLSAQSVMPCDDGCGATAGGAVIGGAVGALVLGGAATLFSASCVDQQSCLWGNDGGAIIGAFVAVPAAVVAGLVIGGVAGTAIVLHQQHEEALVAERRRAPSTGIGAGDAIAADDEVPLLAPRLPPPTPTPPAGAAVVSAPAPAEPTPEERARQPDGVDDPEAP